MCVRGVCVRGVYEVRVCVKDVCVRGVHVRVCVSGVA